MGLLAVLVVTHELGHFLVARLLGVKVEEFGFGFPPRVLGIAKIKRKNGKYRWIFLRKERLFTKIKSRIVLPLYSINLIPLGGFVKITGEDGENRDEPDSFSAQPVWKRFLILFAGIFMNFVLGSLLFSLVFWLGVPEIVSDEDQVSGAKVQITEVATSSPAEIAGIKVGDVVKSFYLFGQQKNSIQKVSEIQKLSRDFGGQKSVMEVLRGDDLYKIVVIPRQNPQEGEGALGVQLARTGLFKYSFWESLKMGPERAFDLTIFMAGYLKDLFSKWISLEKAKVDFSGPLGIVVITNQMKEMGLSYFLQFAGIISVNLAFMNFLPFPALDGGRILFLLIEKIKGRPVEARIEGTIHAIGLYFLLILMVLVTIKDFNRFQDKFAVVLEKIFGN